MRYLGKKPFDERGDIGDGMAIYFGVLIAIVLVLFAACIHHLFLTGPGTPSAQLQQEIQVDGCSLSVYVADVGVGVNAENKALGQINAAQSDLNAGQLDLANNDPKGANRVFNAGLSIMNRVNNEYVVTNQRWTVDDPDNTNNLVDADSSQGLQCEANIRPGATSVNNQYGNGGNSNGWNGKPGDADGY